MKQRIFEFNDYKKYLQAALSAQKGRALRSRLAEALHCQPAFISRVLNTSGAHFSGEHAMLINRFLEHTDEEGHYFVLLLQYARAGSKLLEEYYRSQIQEVQQKRQLVSERIQVRKQLSKQDQMTYYSAWYFSAIHILLLVPEFQTKEAIARYLKLPLQLVSGSLDFLVSLGLAELEGERYKTGSTRIHLSKNSPMISKHHSNWRIKAIQAMERGSGEDFHFSGPICISESDAVNMRKELLSLLEKLEPVIRASQEEAVFCLSMDFFRV